VGERFLRESTIGTDRSHRHTSAAVKTSVQRH
jgi:hypothetical protein